MPVLSRRLFLSFTPAVGVVTLSRSAWAADPAAGAPAAPAKPAPAVDDAFPAQSPELVREMVGVSHGNVARVKELVAQRPSLARASWDWGFGDWESAIDAASHVGNREIAEILISNGARPTLFTAAMLGKLDTVRALVAAYPGIQSRTGPHSITLLQHARAGGAEAAEVVRFLESLGGADPKPALAPLSDAEATMLAGTYAFGSGPRDRVTIAWDKGSLWFERPGGTRRGMSHVGSYAFFAAGSAAVRIRFEVVEGRATTLTVHDPVVVLEARRVHG
jgi:hypothetical protein